MLSCLSLVLVFSFLRQNSIHCNSNIIKVNIVGQNFNVRSKRRNKIARKKVNQYNKTKNALYLNDLGLPY